jgi:hypothetical protein
VYQDVEVNRPGKKGFRVKKPKEKTPKKGKKADASDDEAEAEAPVQPAAKKRGRPAKKEESDDEAPPPKKSRGKAKKVKEEAAEDDGEQEAAPPAAKRGRPKKVKVELKDEDDEEVPVKPGFEKKSKSKKVKTEAKDEDNEEAPVKPVREKKKSKSKKVKPEPITMTQECLEDFTPNPWVETLLSDPIEASDEVMPVSEEPEVPIKTKRSRKKKGEDPSDAVEAAPDSSSKLKKGKAAKTDPEKPQKRFVLIPSLAVMRANQLIAAGKPRRPQLKIERVYATCPALCPSQRNPRDFQF